MSLKLGEDLALEVILPHPPALQSQISPRPYQGMGYRAISSLYRNLQQELPGPDLHSALCYSDKSRSEVVQQSGPASEQMPDVTTEYCNPIILIFHALMQTGNSLVMNWKSLFNRCTPGMYVHKSIKHACSFISYCRHSAGNLTI